MKYINPKKMTSYKNKNYKTGHFKILVVIINFMISQKLICPFQKCYGIFCSFKQNLMMLSI